MHTRAPGHTHKRFARRQDGASIALIAICAVVLIISAFGIFQYYSVTGGSRQLRNAVDAAVLNVSKRVCEVRVPADKEYLDCAGQSKQVGLGNINRIWGKALLINANQEAMMKEGSATGQSSGAADTAFSIANNMNTTLYSSLTNASTLDNFFQQLAAYRGASLLGADTPISKSQPTGVRVAMVNRGQGANLSYRPTQFPKGITIPGVKQGSTEYLAGYVPVAANNRQFCFTPFPPNEMPHLISDTIFDQNTVEAKPIQASATPLPNAFRSLGEATGLRGTLTASACAVANPQRQYAIAIPHAFITIQMDNVSKWYVEGKLVKTIPYQFEPKKLLGVDGLPLKTGGVVHGYAWVGKEYSPSATIWQILNAVPGDRTEPLNRMIQRIQEIQPNFSLQQLQGLLRSQTQTGQISKYVIFPVYQDETNSNPQIQIQPINGNLPAWLTPQVIAEGSQMLVAQEPKQVDSPNYAWAMEPGVKKRAELSGKYMWKPGTGFGQSLGELQLSRTTEIFFDSEGP